MFASQFMQVCIRASLYLYEKFYLRMKPGNGNGMNISENIATYNLPICILLSTLSSVTCNILTS